MKAMNKQSNCQKTSEAYLKTSRTKTVGAMAIAGAALLALNLSTDANAAIVTGTEFIMNGEVVNSPTLDGVRLGAFNRQAYWFVGRSFSFSTYDTSAKIILTQPGSNYNIKLLGNGYQISAGRSFNDYGVWKSGLEGQSGYWGVEFKNSDSTYYGWIEASVNDDGDELTLHSWAYEDVAGQAIAAGDTGSPVPVPGSLALLASGAAGIAALRRRKSAEQ